MTARAKRPGSGSGERFADLVADVRRLDSDTRSSRAAGEGAVPAGANGAKATRLPPIARPKSAASANTHSTENAPPPSFRWPDPGNRHLAAASGVSDQQLNRLGRGEPEPEERIDLHGTRVAEAKRLLVQRIASAQARGLRCIVVVHGRGRGSATNDAPLRDAAPDWLTRGATGRRVLALAPAPRHLGGEGATMVLLRKSGGSA